MKEKILKWIKILLLAFFVIYFALSIPTTIKLIVLERRDMLSNLTNPYRGYEYLFFMFTYIDVLIMEVTILFFSIRGLIRCFLPVGELRLLAKASKKYGWKLPVALGSVFIFLYTVNVYLERAIEDLPVYDEGPGYMYILYWINCLSPVVCVLFELIIITLVAQIKIHIRNRKQRTQ